MNLLIDVKTAHGEALESIASGEQVLRTAAETTLRLAPEGLPEVTDSVQPLALTVVITDDQYLRRLNAQFGGKDEITDVLAFPSGAPDPDSGVLYLGDVIISLPQATIQASASGHKVEQELELLTVHGVLHLLGYDHHDPQAQEQMWAVQQKVLHVLDNPAGPQTGS